MYLLRCAVVVLALFFHYDNVSWKDIVGDDMQQRAWDGVEPRQLLLGLSLDALYGL